MALNAGPAGTEVAYERSAPPAPPALLMMGAGAQMISWPERFRAELADRHTGQARSSTAPGPGRSARGHPRPLNSGRDEERDANTTVELR